MYISITCAGLAWEQMLMKAGGKDLLTLVSNHGYSCLFIAANKGHGDVAKGHLGVY